MYYTIGQVSQMTGTPVSTLRYYDKSGLFPGLGRKNGIRQFGETEIDALRVIDCLKHSGLEIRDIRRFMDWCAEGAETYQQRLDLFLQQKASVEKEIATLHRVLNMLKFKVWYYETALADGSERNLQPPDPASMPDDVRTAYFDSSASKLCEMPTQEPPDRDISLRITDN